MRNVERSPVSTAGVSWGVVCATLVAILVLAPSVGAQEQGSTQLTLARDGETVDCRAEKWEALSFEDTSIRHHRVSGLGIQVERREPGTSISIKRRLLGNKEIPDYNWSFHLGEPTRDVRFDLVGGPLRGKVVTTQGEPLPDIIVCVYLLRPVLPAGVADLSFCVIERTDSRGEFICPDLLPGEYQVSAHGDQPKKSFIPYFESGQYCYRPLEPAAVRVAHGSKSEEVVVKVALLDQEVRIESDEPKTVRVTIFPNGFRDVSIEGQVDAGAPFRCLLPSVPGDIVEFHVDAPDTTTLSATRKLGPGGESLGVRLPSTARAASVTVRVPHAGDLPRDWEWYVSLWPDFNGSEEESLTLPFLSEGCHAVTGAGPFVFRRVVPGRYLVGLSPKPKQMNDEEWAALYDRLGAKEAIEVGQGDIEVVLGR